MNRQGVSKTDSCYYSLHKLLRIQVAEAMSVYLSAVNIIKNHQCSCSSSEIKYQHKHFGGKKSLYPKIYDGISVSSYLYPSSHQARAYRTRQACACPEGQHFDSTSRGGI